MYGRQSLSNYTYGGGVLHKNRFLLKVIDWKSYSKKFIWKLFVLYDNEMNGKVPLELAAIVTEYHNTS